LWSFQAKAASVTFKRSFSNFLEIPTFKSVLFSSCPVCNPGRKLNQNSVRRRLLNHQLDYLIVAIGFYWHFLWQETKQ
jgi:hypothetical protein